MKSRFYNLKRRRLQAYQNRQISEIIHQAYEKSPFYRRLYQGHRLNDFKNLPIVNKATMMENFTEFNTAGLVKEELIKFALDMERRGDFLSYFKDRYIVGLSSGTSGSKGLVLTDKTLSERLPFIFAARSGIPLKLLPFRIIFILRVHNQAFENVNSPFIHLKYVNLMAPLEQIICEINQMKANIIMAPPSMLRMLAEFRSEIKTRLKFTVSYAEVLTPDDKRMVENKLQVPLIQLYQASEGFIGSSCRHQRLHINEDLVYVELLGKDGKEARPGEPCSSMLVTNFYNRLQPLIRYELNDIIVIGEECSCGSGFRVIERILGRKDDIFWFRKEVGDGYQYVFPDFIRRAVISSSENVRQYQVVQQSYGKMLVRLAVNNLETFPQTVTDVRESLLRRLTEFGCRLPEVRIIQAQPERNKASQKLVRIKRDFRHIGK